MYFLNVKFIFSFLLKFFLKQQIYLGQIALITCGEFLKEMLFGPRLHGPPLVSPSSRVTFPSLTNNLCSATVVFVFFMWSIPLCLPASLFYHLYLVVLGFVLYQIHMLYVLSEDSV